MGALDLADGGGTLATRVEWGFEAGGWGVGATGVSAAITFAIGAPGMSGADAVGSAGLAGPEGESAGALARSSASALVFGRRVRGCVAT